MAASPAETPPARSAAAPPPKPGSWLPVPECGSAPPALASQPTSSIQRSDPQLPKLVARRWRRGASWGGGKALREDVAESAVAPPIRTKTAATIRYVLHLVRVQEVIANPEPGR